MIYTYSHTHTHTLIHTKLYIYTRFTESKEVKGSKKHTTSVSWRILLILENIDIPPYTEGYWTGSIGLTYKAFDKR